MPQLNNARHEKFAQGRADGMRQYDAYVAAGFEGNPTAASQLAKRPEVVARIQELTDTRQVAIRQIEGNSDDSIGDLDKQWIMRQLKLNVMEGQKSGQISAANKAIELMMDMMGLTKKSKTPAGESFDKDEEQQPSPTNDAKLGDVLDRLRDLQTQLPECDA